MEIKGISILAGTFFHVHARAFVFMLRTLTRSCMQFFNSWLWNCKRHSIFPISFGHFLLRLGKQNLLVCCIFFDGFFLLPQLLWVPLVWGIKRLWKFLYDWEIVRLITLGFYIIISFYAVFGLECMLTWFIVLLNFFQCLVDHELE